MAGLGLSWWRKKLEERRVEEGGKEESVYQLPHPRLTLAGHLTPLLSPLGTHPATFQGPTSCHFLPSFPHLSFNNPRLNSLALSSDNS